MDSLIGYIMRHIKRCMCREHHHMIHVPQSTLHTYVCTCRVRYLHITLPPFFFRVIRISCMYIKLVLRQGTYSTYFPISKTCPQTNCFCQLVSQCYEERVSRQVHVATGLSTVPMIHSQSGCRPRPKDIVYSSTFETQSPIRSLVLSDSQVVFHCGYRKPETDYLNRYEPLTGETHWHMHVLYIHTYTRLIT